MARLWSRGHRGQDWRQDRRLVAPLLAVLVGATLPNVLVRRARAAPDGSAVGIAPPTVPQPRVFPGTTPVAAMQPVLAQLVLAPAPQVPAPPVFVTMPSQERSHERSGSEPLWGAVAVVAGLAAGVTGAVVWAQDGETTTCADHLCALHTRALGMTLAGCGAMLTGVGAWILYRAAAPHGTVSWSASGSPLPGPPPQAHF